MFNVSHSDAISREVFPSFLLYSPQPFSWDVQPDDGLLEAETCSC
jgi:hypothetical protein